MSYPIIIIILVSAAIVGITAYFLPRILGLLGFHRHLPKQAFNVAGKKALIVTTSHDKLGDKGKPTGVFASEMTTPYYSFSDNGMIVDIASMKGGTIPVEVMSLRWPVASWSDKRFKKDEELLEKVNNSRNIEDIEFSAYDVIFFAGGWGAAYDLGYSEVLGKKVSQAYIKGSLMGAVCHGALGFKNAMDEEGVPLVKDRKIAAVTNKQVKELGITSTPLHPETEMKKLGAKFESKKSLLDLFSTHVAVDGQFVTGQNQNSGQEAAYEIMKLLEKKK